MAGGAQSSFTFKEQLPPSCPPQSAVLKGYEAVWRFVSANPPTDQDFMSYASQKPAPPGVDPCQWASCSVFTKKEAAFQKLPKPRARFSYIACIKITAKCGFTVERKSHVDFWRFSGFKPTIISVEPLVI